MKLHVPTLISGIDAMIADADKAIAERNRKAELRNAKIETDWAHKRAQLIAASKDFAKRIAAKNFDGDVRAAETESLKAAGIDTSEYRGGEFGYHSHPRLEPTDVQAQNDKLQALRELLTTAAQDDEYVSVTFLERLGMKSSQLTSLYRAAYTARAGAK